MTDPSKVFSNDVREAVSAAIEEKTRTLFHNVFYLPYEAHSDSYRLPVGSVYEGVECELGMPVPPAPLLRSYGPDAERYLRTGKLNTERMLEIMKEAGRSLSHEDRILDFGCGAGRMTRWLRLLGDGEEFWGVDVLGPDAFWAREHLGRHFKIFTGVRLPHLPLEDNHFDFVFAGSVFTHLDDLSLAWMLELRRIVRPGGYLYLTICDENTVSVLQSERRDHLERDVLAGNRDHISKFDEFVGDGYDFFTIRRSQIQSTRPESPQVFWRSSYLRETTGQFFEFVAYEPKAYGYQSAVVLRKP